ncbi:MAG: valine--tRNA ligase [Oscillospiraceae bacterium]|nr:valine--tRNA ligase [Oscillospiraceae bacterium]
MPKAYQPAAIEAKWYPVWEEGGYFKPRIDPAKKPFTIMMPPPNITGQLHMGHAMYAIQDALTRFHRMAGDPTLWLPGTDHASIATEVKVLEAMRSEGLSKEEVGREGFLKRAWAWRDEYGGRIVEQLRRLGASCDWSRERFTMDEGLSEAVVEVFCRLYEKGLIYRGDRIIQWCPECGTSLSDIEVEYEERGSFLWHARYPGVDGPGVVIATTRPETMLGDTGVAVNPSDPRYAALVGKRVILPIVGREIPVVADEYVDASFGTGAVKMTPAHDPNDFEVAKRHGLEILRVMNYDGTMNENAGPYAGLTAEETRERVVAELGRLGLLVKVEPYTHNVGVCYRCGRAVEPITSLQWFVTMKPLAEPALEAVRAGATKFAPERFAQVYYNWMENIRDWCISRQLWWGHRVPAYYCDGCGTMSVARTRPERCPSCGSTELRQDEDVLDTWFSSALWPFSTLGWPRVTADLRYFYPTSVLVTGYDIIFFWVARMIFSGVEQTGETPFHTVLIHGLVRDERGRKMSKSAGNGIDPLDVIDQYGADALRWALMAGVSPGSDLRYSAEKAEAARNFANKLWNAARFVKMSLDGQPGSIYDYELDLADKWIITRCQQTIREAERHFRDYDLALAARAIYDFTWSALCDWTIELAKPALLGGDERRRGKARAVLARALDVVLRLLHPFMPFITEEIYSLLPLPGKRGLLIEADWPVPDPALDFPEEAARMDGVIDIARVVRALRLERGVAPGRKARLDLLPAAGWADALSEAAPVFERLAGAQSTRILADRADAPKQAAKAVAAHAEIFIPLGELVDIDKERARIGKALAQTRQEIARGEAKLANEGFTSKAPPSLIAQERAKLEQRRGMLAALEAQAAAVEE